MKWEIKYTAQAYKDIDSIYSYIADVLIEPDIAKSLAGKIFSEIRSLADFPFRCRLYDDEPWKSKGMRILNVKNYLVFFLPNEKDNCVYIVRIMYGGRYINSQLELCKNRYG